MISLLNLTIIPSIMVGRRRETVGWLYGKTMLNKARAPKGIIVVVYINGADADTT